MPPPVTENLWTVTIRADSSGLAAGLYHGTITLTAAPTLSPPSRPTRVSVNLSIWDDPAPPPAVSPASLEFSRPDGQWLSISTGQALLPFSATYARDLDRTCRSPHRSDPAQDRRDRQRRLPAARIRRARRSDFDLRPIPTGCDRPCPHRRRRHNQPGAAWLPGLVQWHRSSAHLPLGGADQRAVVPYEVAGSPTVTVEIDGGGVHSPAWTIPVAPAAPGVFTQEGSGQGAAAVLDQDSSLNTAENPASGGSVIQIFLTGEGTTNPPGVTGEITQLDVKSPAQPVTVEIGGIEAALVSATTAPFAIAGMFQVNARVPAGSPTGSVPLLVRIGNASSQPAATVSVQ